MPFLSVDVRPFDPSASHEYVTGTSLGAAESYRRVTSTVRFTPLYSLASSTGRNWLVPMTVTLT